MPVPSEIHELVARFEQHLDAYKSGRYNETQLRRDFLDPFFKALGWDVENAAGYAEAYREVLHEDSLHVGGLLRSPDYSFRVGKERKFFAEAKKPSTYIREEVPPAFQIRSYAWSAQLPLSILTDFEEFAVYDGRVKPFKDDPADKARIAYFTFRDYPAKWDWLVSIFSRTAILKGSFDKYVADNKTKRGTTTFDQDFLAALEAWRKLLAANIALRNLALSQREVNFAVQRILDRVIFLRIAEDRGIEPYGKLLSLTGTVPLGSSQGADGGGAVEEEPPDSAHSIKRMSIYPRLCEYFGLADQRYNSGLFHFSMEKGRVEEPDRLTLGLQVDDGALKEILKNLYYPNCPYAFSLVPTEILGHVYEQFLGSVIRLTEGHQARIEQKPEVRKAGGVYYTPTYIVDYIVEHTLGSLVEGKSPAQVERIRVLDPACGSGSFLLGAYEFFLRWHLGYYVAHEPKKWARGKDPRIFETAPNACGVGQGSGNWQLTTAERKRILLNNIYGVDIDYQAVEVTKLSLLLKVLEGEAREYQGQVDFHRVLPDLGNNIKCGNSLIGPDFYNGHQLALFDEEERLKVNVFDWAAEFREIMQNGGFDVVIGNPPYIRIQILREIQPEVVDYLSSHFEAAARGNYDLYVIFVERALQLLRPQGISGFILPHKFFNSQYGAALRNLLAAGRHVRQIVHFGAEQVFHGATTYTCLLFLSKAPAPRLRVHWVQNLVAWVNAPDRAIRTGVIAAKHLVEREWNFHIGPERTLLDKLAAKFPRLGTAADIFVGLQTSADDVFILSFLGTQDRLLVLQSKAAQDRVLLEQDLLHPLLSGTDVQGFAPMHFRQYILFPYTVLNETASLLPLMTIAKNYPRVAQYLETQRRRLTQREHGAFKGEKWHRFGRNQNLGIQSRPKVCVPRLVHRLRAALDLTGSFFLDNVDVGGVTFKPDFAAHDLRYLCALLNSRLLAWYLPKISAPFRGGWVSANRQFLSKLPFRRIDFSLKSDAIAHQRLTEMVNQMSALHIESAAARTPQGKTSLDRQIALLTRQMDHVIYDLYALSADDIACVESTI